MGASRKAPPPSDEEIEGMWLQLVGSIIDFTCPTVKLPVTILMAWNPRRARPTTARRLAEQALRTMELREWISRSTERFVSVDIHFEKAPHLTEAVRTIQTKKQAVTVPTPTPRTTLTPKELAKEEFAWHNLYYQVVRTLARIELFEKYAEGHYIPVSVVLECITSCAQGMNRPISDVSLRSAVLFRLVQLGYVFIFCNEQDEMRVQVVHIPLLRQGPR